jgi:hypothetical protein
MCPPSFLPYQHTTHPHLLSHTSLLPLPYSHTHLMASGSVTVPPGEAAAPLNFIYACSICCYTLADVYEGQNETVQGLSDGINPKDRLVTHLYLASCCHVFCGSHLEGGGRSKPNAHGYGMLTLDSTPISSRRTATESAMSDLPQGEERWRASRSIFHSRLP